MNRFFIGLWFFIELILNLPGFMLCFLIFYFSKNQKTADKVVDALVGKGFTWGLSFVVWFVLWYLW